MIKEVVLRAPFLSGLSKDKAQKISDELKAMWESEVKDKKSQFSRQPGQSVEDRLAPGFDWIKETEGSLNRQIAVLIQKTTLLAALSVDRNTGKPFDDALIAKVRRHVDGLRIDVPEEVLAVIPAPEIVETMDFWN
jgi:hypothetical protein